MLIDNLQQHYYFITLIIPIFKESKSISQITTRIKLFLKKKHQLNNKQKS